MCFYGKMPLLEGLIGEVRYRNFGVMALVALAIAAVYEYCVAVAAGVQRMDLANESATQLDAMPLAGMPMPGIYRHTFYLHRTILNSISVRFR